jgi:L-iditol 2-dehydrogenase
MKVVRLYSPEDIRVEDAPVPRPGPGEALVRTVASGICTGDVLPWYISRKAPLVLGHEPAGRVVELGPGVEDFQVGDRVALHHHAPCMHCPLCRRGAFVHCATWRQSRLIPGGLAEFILVPRVNLQHDTLKLPPQVDFEDATLVEPLGCVLKALGRAGPIRGKKVLVMGLGPMGALHVLAARHLGASEVVGADVVPYRLRKALQLGAHRVLDLSAQALAEASEPEVVVVGPGSARALGEALQVVAPQGVVVMFTPLPPEEVFLLRHQEFYFKDLTLLSSYSAGPPETRQALELIQKGVVRASMLVSHRFPLQEAPRAYRLVAQAQDCLKVIITFENA